jgi:hypothetical protein
MWKLFRWFKRALETGEHVEFIHGIVEWVERVFGIRLAVVSLLLSGASSAWAWIKGRELVEIFIVGLAVLALALLIANQWMRFKSLRRQKREPPIPSLSLFAQPEHRWRKYYAIAEAASLIGVSEETLYQLAIPGDVVLSVVRHSPANLEEVSQVIRDGKAVKVTTRTTTFFSAQSDPTVSLDLWYISPRDAKNAIRNPVGAVTLIGSIYKDRECVPERGMGLSPPLKITKSDLLISSEEFKRFVAHTPASTP